MQQFPHAHKLKFKEKFVERYSKLTEWETFKLYSLSFLRKSIRVNTLKNTVAEVTKRMSASFKLEPVPWCSEGFWVVHEEGRRDIGNTVEHALGYIYVQEAASMIPPEILVPKPGQAVLDLCAAPGSKTTQMAAMMQNTGVIAANDVTGERLAALGINLQRIGARNVIVTQYKGEHFPEMQFDRILVDAPCTATGAIRKSPQTLEIWNPEMVKRLSGLQKKLLLHAWTLLKPKGTLVYSTCTLEPEENEGVIDWFLRQQPQAKIEDIELNIKRSNAVTEFEGKTFDSRVKKCLRVWPQDNDTEGFFAAKIVKQ